MHLTINYTTAYHYTEPALRVTNLMRVAPLSFDGQTVLDWRIDVDSDARLREHRDGYGNIVHMLYVDHPVERLSVEVTGRVLTEDRAGIVAGLPGELPPHIFLRQTPLSAPAGALHELAGELERLRGAPLELLHVLNAQLYGTLRFDVDATGVGTTAAEAYAAGHGVCQDYVHIFIGAARAVGIPARYVSGHLFRRDTDERQPATHAWAEAHVPDLGWIAFDPTNGISADDAYVRVCAGLDYRDAAPFSGTVQGGGRQELKVRVDVRQAQSQRQSQQQGQQQQ